MWFQNRRAKHKRIEQVKTSMQSFSEESLTMDLSEKDATPYDSYEERIEEVKMNIGSSFTRYITLSNNVRDSISHPYPCVPVLVYNPRTGSDPIVSR